MVLFLPLTLLIYAFDNKSRLGAEDKFKYTDYISKFTPCWQPCWGNRHPSWPCGAIGCPNWRPPPPNSGQYYQNADSWGDSSYWSSNNVRMGVGYASARDLDMAIHTADGAIQGRESVHLASENSACRDFRARVYGNVVDPTHDLSISAGNVSGRDADLTVRDNDFLRGGQGSVNIGVGNQSGGAIKIVVAVYYLLFLSVRLFLEYVYEKGKEGNGTVGRDFMLWPVDVISRHHAPNDKIPLLIYYYYYNPCYGPQAYSPRMAGGGGRGGIARGCEEAAGGGEDGGVQEAGGGVAAWDGRGGRQEEDDAASYTALWVKSQHGASCDNQKY
ncbi:uncharacterized protein A4U43_C09F60 [Asparagus officinalis]|uniref:Uncharacterized protein n=1 Tax=Asparagus officinalis TaxID=4686 RepID=A0A5P1E5Y5_ASPOF|nr:uncharacterized protein A4U43_C09F60 [Asparagus officinalis]